jgi:hypothetical protein
MNFEAFVFAEVEQIGQRTSQDLCSCEVQTPKCAKQAVFNSFHCHFPSSRQMPPKVCKFLLLRLHTYAVLVE